MKKDDQLLEWAKNHRGSLRAIARKKGTAYLYRYCRGGVVHNETFPAGLNDEVIKAKIMEFERMVLLEKVGIMAASPPAEYQKKRGGMTLKELCVWYIEIALQEGKSKETVENCELIMRRLMKWLGDDEFPVDAIDRNHLNDFARLLLKTNSQNSARSLLTKVHTVFQKGYYEQKITNLPFVGFKYPEAGEPRQKPILTLAEMRDVAGMFKDWRMRLAWDVARFSGLRGNDILNLHAESFDLSKRVLKFRSKKMKRDENLPLHPCLVDIIKPCLRQSGKLFTYKWSDVLGVNFREKIRELKGSDFGPSGSHTPRHSLSAYLRNEAKWPVDDIALFLGHRPKSITQRFYTHDDAVELLREKLDSLPLDGGA